DGQRRVLVDVQGAAVHGERRALGEGREAGLRIAGGGDEHPVRLGPPAQVVHLRGLIGGGLGGVLLREGDEPARGGEQAVQRLRRTAEELVRQRRELGQ